LSNNPLIQETDEISSSNVILIKSVLFINANIICSSNSKFVLTDFIKSSYAVAFSKTRGFPAILGVLKVLLWKRS
jgi:hypothetical protein